MLLSEFVPAEEEAGVSRYLCIRLELDFEQIVSENTFTRHISRGSIVPVFVEYSPGMYSGCMGRSSGEYNR